MEVMKELGIINSESTPNIIDVDSTFFKEVVRE